MRLKSRAYEVEAVQYDGTEKSFKEMLKRFGGAWVGKHDPELQVVSFRTWDKIHFCTPGQWVIRTDAGLFYVQKDRFVRENFDTENPTA